MESHVNIILNGHVTILTLDLLLPCCSDSTQLSHVIIILNGHVTILTLDEVSRISYLDNLILIS